MTKNEYITIVIVVYISVVMYIALLCLVIHNIYAFLYRQKKYRNFALSLFYFLTIPCILIRFYTNIWILDLLSYVQLFPLAMPPAMKISIALSQILVMVELTISIEQLHLADKKWSPK